MSDREHDVVVMGASGFAGRLVAGHLAEHAPAGARVALAGRSRERLAAVRDRLGEQAADWPLLVADSADAAALDAVARSTQVVATTVGPYARYGLPLVQACAQAGTHYADLAGETLFVRQSIERFHTVAGENGARIVHACGFDSVPSDLAVLLLHERAAQDGAGELGDTALLVLSMRGGTSGGTIDSLRNQVDVTRSDRGARAVLADPYALSPYRSAEPDLGDERDPVQASYDPVLGRWVAPFVMGPFNSRIVRRSNALQDWGYGKAFRYREVMAAGRGALAPVRAVATTAALWSLAAGMALPATRPVLDRILPKPGEGPGEKARANGRFRVRTTTSTSSGARYRATVAAKGDPGYAATSVMLGQAALSLALDADALPPHAGVLTPATGIGDALVRRLRAQGFTLEVEPG